MKVEISKRNIITNVEQWHQFAPPKDSDKHWKEGSSKEGREAPVHLVSVYEGNDEVLHRKGIETVKRLILI